MKQEDLYHEWSRERWRISQWWLYSKYITINSIVRHCSPNDFRGYHFHTNIPLDSHFIVLFTQLPISFLYAIPQGFPSFFLSHTLSPSPFPIHFPQYCTVHFLEGIILYIPVEKIYVCAIPTFNAMQFLNTVLGSIQLRGKVILHHHTFSSPKALTAKYSYSFAIIARLTRLREGSAVSTTNTDI